MFSITVRNIFAENGIFQENSWNGPHKVFDYLFVFVNDTVALALESYLGLEGPGRKKRSWLEGLGELSRDVCGTAM